MDEGARHADAFKTNLSSCSVAAQKYVDDAKKMQVNPLNK